MSLGLNVTESTCIHVRLPPGQANVANGSSLHCEDQNMQPHIRSALFVATAIVICCTGAVGNFMVLLAPRMEKKLRKVSFYLLCHLSAVDLFNSLVSLPLYLTMVSTPRQIASCWIWMKASQLLPIMSAFGHCVISFNRYLLVTRVKSDYSDRFSNGRSVLYLITGWCFTSLVIGLLILIDERPASQEGNNQLCSAFPELNRTRLIATSTITCFSALYLGVSFVFYSRLTRYVRKHAAAMAASKRADSKVSRTLLALCVFWTGCLLLSPMLVVVAKILNDKTARLAQTLDEIGTISFFLKNCVNPFVYLRQIVLFRQTLKRMCLRPNNVIPLRQSSQTVATGNLYVTTSSQTRQAVPISNFVATHL